MSFKRNYGGSVSFDSSLDSLAEEPLEPIQNQDPNWLFGAILRRAGSIAQLG